MDISKLRFVLPNLFTLANLFAGVYSIQLALHAESVEGISLAAWFIVIAMVFDLFDGRVARMTNAQSEFGAQMDSLTDAVSFGVAPGLLLYSWGLQPLGTLGVFVAFVFVCCAIMRLARFNIMAKMNGGSSKYFLGLPTPLAAGAVVSVVLAHASVTGKFQTHATWNVAAMGVLMGGLMVSNIKYRTFKDINFRGRALAVAFILASLASLIAVIAEPSVAFVTAMALYIVVGLGGGIVHWSRSFFGEDEEDEPLGESIRDEDGYLVEVHEDE